MAVKQLTAFIENQPGKLKTMVEAISKADVNIRAMSIADTKDFGILRIIVSDTDKAKAALAASCVTSVIEVIAVKMTDKAGSLAEILGVLDKAGVNIEYMYAFTAPADKGAYVVIRVDDNASAEKVLKEHNIETLTDAEIEAF